MRIDDAVAAAAADRMPALALTDLANQFGLIKFYTAARARGIKPIAGCDVWIANDSERDQPSRVLLLAATRDGYLRLCDWLSRAYRAHQHRGRARTRPRVVRRRHRRPDRAVRRARRRRRPGAAAGQRHGRAAARDRMARPLSARATSSRCSAPATPTTRRWCSATVRARRRGRRADRRDASDPVPDRATISARTRRACASPKAIRSSDHAAAAPLHARSSIS